MKKAAQPVMPKMGPTLHLDGEHAEPFMKRKVGDKVQFHGDGVVSDMSQHEGETGTTHHVAIKVKNLKHRRKAATGRAGGKDADMQDGGKAAMDTALGNEETAEDEE